MEMNYPAASSGVSKTTTGKTLRPKGRGIHPDGNKFSAKAGIQENTGFPRIKYGAGLVKPGMTIKEYNFFGCANIYDALYNNGNPISSLCLRYPSAHNLAKVLTLNMYPTLSVTLIAPRASRRLKV